ncbi:MAG: VanZ family protein [Ilumatobacteraceae bacterium]
MLTDFLLHHRWIAPTVLAFLILLGPPMGSWLAGRPRVAWWLAASSLVPVALVTLVPQNRRLFSRCELTSDWYWPTPGRVELLANVVLFVAPVLLVTVATRRPLLALAAGAGLSAVIEAIQAAVPSLGRSCDRNDWITNTIGAAIGATLGWTALRLARRGH